MPTPPASRPAGRSFDASFDPSDASDTLRPDRRDALDPRDPTYDPRDEAPDPFGLDQSYGDDDDDDYPDVDALFPLPVETPDAPELTPDPSEQTEEGQEVYGVSPEGTLLRGAAQIAQGLADAKMPGELKSLALRVFVDIYAHQPKHWPQNAPPPGVYHVQVRELARELEDRASNVSTRFRQLVEWGVLGRGTGKYINGVWFRPVAEWSPVLFDNEAARARHRRAGAGAPARVRDPNPMTPLSARPSDVYRRVFITRELVVEALGTTRLDRIEDVWPVIEHFQRTFDESFRIQWLDTLLAFLDAGKTPSLIIATASEIKLNAIAKGKSTPYRPWGYLKTCLANAPDAQAALTPSPAREEKGPSAHGQHGYAHTQPSTRSAIAAPNVHPDSASDTLARAQARSARRYGSTTTASRDDGADNNNVAKETHR